MMHIHLPFPLRHRLARIVLAVALVSASSACTGQAHVEQPVAGGAEDVVDASHGLLGQLRAHPRAPEVAAELDRASRWLRQAEALIADGDGDDDITELTLLAVRAELSAIKSHYQRREAEAALSQVRGESDTKRANVRDLEARNRTLQGGE